MAKRTGDLELVGTIVTPDGATVGAAGEALVLTAGAGNAVSGDGGSVTIASGAAVSSSTLIAGQDETNFDGLGNNGIFVAGDGAGPTAYAIGDAITLSDCSVITVDSVDGGNGDVVTFTVTTSGSTVTASATLAQIGASVPNGGFGFNVTPESANF